MDPTQPQSAAVIALVPFVVAVFWGARSVTARATRDDLLARLATPAVGVAAWLVAVHVVGLLARSFTWGLWLGTAGAGIVAAVVALPRLQLDVPPVPALSSAMWGPAIAGTLLLAPAALGWSFHDELWQVGHQSIASQIQNDIYPPRHGVFPAYPLRYHYGFDLLVAMVGAITRLPVARAIDLVTIAAWAYAWCIAWGIGERLLGARRGWIMPIAVLLAGPFTRLSPTLGAPEGIFRLLGLVKSGGALLNPPLASYFFQHPWALGIPLSLAALWLALDDHHGRPAWRAVVIFTLFLALAISQIVLFLSLLPALSLMQGVLHIRRRPRESLAWIAGATLVIALASRLGGFFAPVPFPVSADIQFHPWSQTGHAASNFLWTALSLGWTLPLGVTGLALLFRHRTAWGLVLASMSIGSLLVLNLLRYVHSWDIAKFATLALFALAICSSVAIARLWAVPSRPLVRATAFTCLLLVASPGLGFLACFTTSARGIPSQIFAHQPPPLAEDDVAALAWLRRHVRAGDLVLCAPEMAPRCAQVGGLPQLQIDSGTMGFSIPAEIRRRRETINREAPADPRAYRAEGVRWMVVPDDSQFPSPDRVAEWRRRGAIEEIRRFGSLAIYAIQAGDAAGATAPVIR